MRFRYCIVIHVGPPSAPLSPKFFPESLTSAILSWTPPTQSLCVISYTITLTNITEGNVSYMYNTTINTTNITVSDLTQGVEYSFTVAGVDAGGRVGEDSMLAQAILFDSELKPCAIHHKTFLKYMYRFLMSINK